MHGKGIMNFEFGGQYEGDWEQGKMQGKGIMNFEFGGQYEEVERWQEAWQGTVTYPNGFTYVGEWKGRDGRRRHHDRFRWRQICWIF